MFSYWQLLADMIYVPMNGMDDIISPGKVKIYVDPLSYLMLAPCTTNGQVHYIARGYYRMIDLSLYARCFSSPNLFLISFSFC